MTSATFRALAQSLRDRCAREPGWLGGVFPGDDAALTALAAKPDGDGWHWQTWHLYPTGVGRDSGLHGKSVASVSRNRLLWIAGGLAVAATAFLVSGLLLLHKDIGSYIASHYHEYSRDASGTRYACTGSPEAGGRHARQL